MKEISVEALKEQVLQQVSSPHLSSNQARIVWFDSMLVDLVQFTDVTDGLGFGTYLAHLDDRISVIDSPFREEYNGDELIRWIPDHIVKFKNGECYTRVLIMALAFNSKELIQKVIKQAQELSGEYPISIYVFLPLSKQSSLDGDLSALEQFHCTEAKEDALERWLNRASGRKGAGIQIVDNFYLDFLLHNTQFIDTTSSGGVCYSHPSKWERCSNKLVKAVKELISIGSQSGNQDEARTVLSSLKLEGSINLLKLSNLLSSLPDDVWDDWLKFHGGPRGDNSNAVDRIDEFKRYLCSFSVLGNQCNGVEEALTAFHDIVL